MMMMMKESWRLISTGVLVVTLLTALLAAPSPVRAAAILVTNPNDAVANNDGCSLREAVLAVNGNKKVNECNASGGVNLIALQPGQTYTLIQEAEFGDLDLTASMSIVGDINSLPIIDAAGVDRVLHIANGASVSLTGVILQGGGNVSGAISRGGAIYLESGKLGLNYTEVRSSGMVGPNVVNAGGGLYVSKGASAVLSRSIVRGNTANRGGGIYNAGTLNITYSSLMQNSALDEQYPGGALYNDPDAVYARLVNTTISQNTGKVAGIASASTLLLENSTVVDNTGIGLRLTPGAASSVVKNSIIARQISAANCELANELAPVLAGRRNLADDNVNTCHLNTNQGDRVVTTVEAKIDSTALQYDGSFTPMYALLEGSPAVGAGQNCTGFDQREKVRAANCALGSYELGGTDPLLTMLPLVVR
jgi:CSLREA domain-containing protein